MNLLDILQPDCIKAPMVATDKRAAIHELVDVRGAPPGGVEPQDAHGLADSVGSHGPPPEG